MAKLSRVLAVATGMLGLCVATPVAAQTGVFDWTGFYVGVNGGYAFGNTRTVNIDETFATAPFFNADFGSLSMSGGFGGVQIGRNVQWGNWVVGLEADVQGADIKGSSSATFTPFLAPGGVATVTTTNTVDLFGTVRPRIGFVWDRALLYATGGAAWGSVRHTIQFADNFGFSAAGEKSGARIGYSAGGGIEFAFSPNLSAKVEYLYVDLGVWGQKEPEFFGAAATAFAVATDTRTDFHIVRAGLNYKFGSGMAQEGGYPTKAPLIGRERFMDWTGVYVGGHAGWLWAESQATFTGAIPAASISGSAGQTFLASFDSAILGAQAGFQYQIDRLVIGIEGTLTLALRSFERSSRELCPKQTIALFNCLARVDDIFTAGGRLGWSMGDWLPYVSGGYAHANLEARNTNRSLAPVNVTIVWWDSGLDGWYIGGGVDWVLMPGVTLGIDYRHYDFGNQPVGAKAIIGGIPQSPLPNDNANFKVTADTLTLRASYRFSLVPPYIR